MKGYRVGDYVNATSGVDDELRLCVISDIRRFTNASFVYDVTDVMDRKVTTVFKWNIQGIANMYEVDDLVAI